MSYHTASKFIEKLGYTFMTPIEQIKLSHTPEDAEEIIELMTNEDPATITVTDPYFGDKKMTKDEFCEIWTKQVHQLKRISYEFDFAAKVDEFARVVKQESGEEFDRIYKIEQNK